MRPLPDTPRKSRTYEITGGIFDLDSSPILLQDPLSNLDGWIQCGEATWNCEDGALQGATSIGGVHGQIFHPRAFRGDVVMEFDAQTVLPSTHDIIWWWHTEIVDRKWGKGYLGGLAGWWRGLAGLEKAPNFTLAALVPMAAFTPGQIYHIVSGSVGARSFLFVDDALLLESLDCGPFPKEHSGHVGFGVYQSRVRITNWTVRAPQFTPIVGHYPEESSLAPS